jgi:hypothetical protein
MPLASNSFVGQQSHWQAEIWNSCHGIVLSKDGALLVLDENAVKYLPSK